MANIKIDGQDVTANPQDNLLQVCLSHGFDLPYFCWHPALGSVGACRQCAVKQFANPDDKTGQDCYGLHDTSNGCNTDLNFRRRGKGFSGQCDRMDDDQSSP